MAALRRWKPFLGAFALIDAAIEAADADGLLSRDEFRGARARIIELICDAADDEKAEGLCALLDEAMERSLDTLRAVPVGRIELASGDLVGAVGALTRDHASERVRALARDVVRGWKTEVSAELARARAAMNVLDGLSSAPAPAAGFDTKANKIPEEQPRPVSRKMTVVGNSRRVTELYAPLPKMKMAPIGHRTSNAKPQANMGAPAAVPVPTKPKKVSAAIVSNLAEEETKMEATKRKLHVRYQEAQDAKRRRTIQVIKPPQSAPGTAGQAHGNAHLGTRPVSCKAERCFKKSSSLRMKV
ncbi:hypothetical protein HU200_036075 [Digitaria exilis]|uniref:TFIIS N-terminal domain-containing protein n=1 Tax=Digitaria exilis TaxID=1010633 RepID=A0A835BGY5_9POAL|nr:hypothetical protein HU200_036075 [Digitaria exilis]